MAFPPGFEVLAAVARIGVVAGEALSDHGLILLPELATLDDWCTPANALAFAATGGDGVHFSVIDTGDGATEASPVVMTVPMAIGDRRPNHIVGGSIRDLLCLGVDTGWFTLEQLAYDDGWPARIELAKGRPRSPVVQQLADELGLAPWPDVAGRLRALDEQHRHRLAAPRG